MHGVDDIPCTEPSAMDKLQSANNTADSPDSGTVFYEYTVITEGNHSVKKISQMINNSAVKKFLQSWVPCSYMDESASHPMMCPELGSIPEQLFLLWYQTEY